MLLYLSIHLHIARNRIWTHEEKDKQQLSHKRHQVRYWHFQFLVWRFGFRHAPCIENRLLTVDYYNMHSWLDERGREATFYLYGYLILNIIILLAFQLIPMSFCGLSRKMRHHYGWFVFMMLQVTVSLHIPLSDASNFLRDSVSNCFSNHSTLYTRVWNDLSTLCPYSRLSSWTVGITSWPIHLSVVRICLTVLSICICICIIENIDCYLFD